jgi:hypothetical protein
MKKLLERPKHGWEDNIIVDLEDVVSDVVY